MFEGLLDELEERVQSLARRRERHVDSVDGLTIWPSKYPEIPAEVFEGVGVATNAEG